jgi:hypothetical protein
MLTSMFMLPLRSAMSTQVAAQADLIDRHGVLARLDPHTACGILRAVPQTTASSRRLSGEGRLVVEQHSGQGTAVMWEVGPWRCEHRIDPDRRHWVNLYKGDELALSRPVNDADQVSSLAEYWRAIAEGTPQPVMAEPSRRRLDVRRRSARGGRRHDDPRGEPPTDNSPG